VLGAPMTVQTPVIFSQRLKGEGTASEGKTLVLTGMVRGDDVYVILISATRRELEEKQD
jgi:hypothetical protein